MAKETILTEEDKANTDASNEEESGKDENEKVEDQSAEEKDDKASDTETKDKDGKADESDEGAPEKYEDFTMPEELAADKELTEKFKKVAKERNWTQAEAQELVDLQSEALTRAADDMMERWEKVNDDWRKEAENDKDIGGEGFKENVGFAKKAVEQFGNKKLAETLEETGMGNHPEIIRFLANVGKQISEDGVMSGGNESGDKKDAASILFPNMK
jgi:hypothetical protein